MGTPRQTQIPPMELPRYGAERLSGIRCIATQLKSEPPNEAALTAMALQRLDALVLLNITGSGFEKRGGGATGYVKEIYLAHLVPHPEASWTVSAPMSLDVLTDQDLLELVEGWEADFEQKFIAREVEGDRDRVLVVSLKTDDTNTQRYEDGIAEIARLVETAGGEVLENVKQKRSRPHPQTVVGEGKVQEIALVAQTIGANLIVFDRASFT